ncbi:MAG: molybdopterin molybdotransferase MoeA [Lutibacter sp.]|uniref:molybdopterin molybdotransferase MoeA n=1 Tax=Lutibacter sp. TaxID=1925666 RepID=UPI0017FA17E4|nr:molybdopterin molybdotransferase MoeA [Lutibacter sp.]MBT8318447.1 molybdopterin molybdotransferase MoeA [Lutibacter sp.]NNJ59305.1 molybdopterin molybdotransferase MoeA [Lutibacter sp.]
MSLTTAQEALKIILDTSEDFGTEEVKFLKSLGRTLKEDILADRDFPPFNRISMDGIAISSEAFNKGQRSFKIEGVQAAGSKQLTMQNPANCIEAMTGAVLPKNTDIVIQYELLDIKDGVATVNLEAIKSSQNVHLKGLDRKKGDILIPKNTLISPAEIGVFATVGKMTVKVAKQPKVMIISTGNELVGVCDTPEEHQIRRSNVYTLVSLLEKLNIHAETAHITDDKELLLTKINSFLNDFDVLLFSGAVSKGKFDFIPEVLDELGVDKLFHRVKQRPGKPFWFGKKDHKTIFAFPGNPVSTFASCLKYFYPWYYKSVGINYENKNQAILAEDYFFKPDLTYFLQVKVTKEDGKVFATPITGRGSADLANLVDSDAFLELPDDRSNFTKGEVFPLITYR